MLIRGRMVRAGVFLTLVFGGAAGSLKVCAEQPAFGVGALGRLQPKDGVRRVAGPSDLGAVLSELFVDIGDNVTRGQLLARLDDYNLFEVRVDQLDASMHASKAAVNRLEASLAMAEADLERTESLHHDGLVSEAELEQDRLRQDSIAADLEAGRWQVVVAERDVESARADLARREIRSPIAGQVLQIHARGGERVGEKGVLDIGATDQMYVVAEVYESDIPRIHLEQRASIESPVLSVPVGGQVERINPLVGSKSLREEDPTAMQDVRIVEVEVRLDDSAAVATYTGLVVQVRFGSD